MIESVEELTQVLGQMEANLAECDRLQAESKQLPWWAFRRERKNLDRRLELFKANAPLWAKLNEGLAPGVPVTIKTKFIQNGRVIAEGEITADSMETEAVVADDVWMSKLQRSRSQIAEGRTRSLDHEHQHVDYPCRCTWENYSPDGVTWQGWRGYLCAEHAAQFSEFQTIKEGIVFLNQETRDA